MKNNNEEKILTISIDNKFISHMKNFCKAGPNEFLVTRALPHCFFKKAK